MFFPRQQAQWNFAALLAALGPQNFGLLGPPGPHIIGLSTLARPWTVVGVVGHHLPLLPAPAVLSWRRRRIWVLYRCWLLALGLGSNLGCGLHVGSRLLASWLLEHLHGDQGSCRLLEDHGFLGHGAGRGSSWESVAAVVCMHRSIRGLEAVGTTGFLYMARSWLQVEKKSRNLTCMLPLFALTWYSHYAWLKRNKSSYGLAQKKSRAAGIFFSSPASTVELCSTSSSSWPAKLWASWSSWPAHHWAEHIGPAMDGSWGRWTSSPTPPSPGRTPMETAKNLGSLPVLASGPWPWLQPWVRPSRWQPASCQLASGAPSWRSGQLQAS